MKRTAKTLIRLGGCPGWSESSLGAQPHCWFCHVAAQLQAGPLSLQIGCLMYFFTELNLNFLYFNANCVDHESMLSWSTLFDKVACTNVLIQPQLCGNKFTVFFTELYCLRTVETGKENEPRPTKGVRAQRRLRSAWVSAQSDQSLHCLHEESLCP